MFTIINSEFVKIIDMLQVFLLKMFAIVVSVFDTVSMPFGLLNTFF